MRRLSSTTVADISVGCGEGSTLSWKNLLKSASVSCQVYGPLKRLHRRLFDDEALQRSVKNIAFYKPFLCPGDLCFDIGSHIGEKTEAFLVLGTKVVAFEPQPGCFRETKARCSPNRRLTAVNAALGSAPGELPMYICENT